MVGGSADFSDPTYAFWKVLITTQRHNLLSLGYKKILGQCCTDVIY